MTQKKVALFSSGSERPLTSLLHLFPGSETGSYRVSVVVSHREDCGARDCAEKCGIPFEYFPAPWTAERCEEILQRYGIEFSLLWGWWQLLEGLDPAKAVNVHPALLSFGKRRFGGKGWFGKRVHEEVYRAFAATELEPGPRCGFTMHFVTAEYDKGPSFYEETIPLKAGMTAADIEKSVKEAERTTVPMIFDMVVRGLIRLENPERADLFTCEPYRVVVPVGFQVPKASIVP